MAIPILSKIQNHALLVREVKINSGQAKGLLGNFLIQKDLIERIYLDSNGLDGNSLSNIIHGLNKQVPFKSLIV